MKTILVCLVAVLAMAGLGLADDKQATPVVAEIAKNYRKLRMVTTQPVNVNPEVAAMCAAVPKGWVEEMQKTKGPHAYTVIRVFMNEAGAEAFVKSATSFPEGAVIVKEKMGQTNGVGGMVKRHTGFDPDHGDWEFFYFEDPAKIESGKIASCIRCHDGARQDHVFGDWAKMR
jgi:hypothetical protein